MKAVTDPEKEIRYDEQRPGLSNLMTIYAAISGLPMEAIQEKYMGRGYAAFKKDLSDVLITCLNPIQEKYRGIIAEKAFLASILKKGAQSAFFEAGDSVESINVQKK